MLSLGLNTRMQLELIRWAIFIGDNQGLELLAHSFWAVRLHPLVGRFYHISELPTSAAGQPPLNQGNGDDYGDARPEQGNIWHSKVKELPERLNAKAHQGNEQHARHIQRPRQVRPLVEDYAEHRPDQKHQINPKECRC